MTPYAGIDTFPATIPLPQDSVDKRSASVFNGCYQPLMDAVRWLKNRTGGYRLVTISSLLDDGTSQWGTTWTTTSFGVTDIALTTLSGCEIGDLVVARLNVAMVGTDLGSHAEARLAWAQNGGGKAELTGARHYVHVPNLAGEDAVSHTVSLQGLGVVSAAGTAAFYLQGRVISGLLSPDLTAYEPYTWVVEHWRPN